MTPVKKRKRCINCGINMVALKTFKVADLEPSERDLLQQWVDFTPVQASHVLCTACRALLVARAALGGGEGRARALGHAAVCLTCGGSVFRQRHHALARRLDVAAKLREWAADWQGSHLDRACHACWKRAEYALCPRPSPMAEQFLLEDNTATEELQREDEEQNDRQSTNTLANITVQNDVQPANTSANTTAATELVTALTLPSYRRVRATSRRCVFRACADRTLRVAPLAQRQSALVAHRLYIPNTIRVCPSHAAADFEALMSHTSSKFTGDHIEDMVFLMKNIRPIDFTDIAGMDPHLRRFWLGVTREEFKDTLDTTPELRRSSDAELALAIYLVNKHSEQSVEVLASLFQVSRAAVEGKLKVVTECLAGKGDASKHAVSEVPMGI